MSDENSGFAVRLREALGKKSVNAVAQQANMSEGVLRKYLNGSIPGIDKAAELARVLGVSFEWLATGTGHSQSLQIALASQQQRTGIGDVSDEELSIGFGQSMAVDGSGPAPLMTLVPVLDVQASAGGGSLVYDDSTNGYIAFSKIWLEKLGLTASKLFTVPSTGESMEPTIKPGEFLLCSRADHHKVPGDGIYLIRIDDHILVKRIQCLPGKRLKITSDNAAYETYEIALDDGVDFEVLGKVVFAHGLRWL